MESHRMDRRAAAHNYAAPGIYHITIKVADARRQSLSRLAGDVHVPDYTDVLPMRKGQLAAATMHGGSRKAEAAAPQLTLKD